MSKQSDLVSVSQGSGGDPLYIDTTNDRVGIGTSSPATSAQIISPSGNFNTTFNDFDGVNIHLEGNGTNGSGNYGNGISWSTAGGGSEKMAAVSSVQTEGDSNRVGLAFFTHPSGTGGDPLEEAMRLDHNGNLLVGTTDVGIDSGNTEEGFVYVSGNTFKVSTSGQPVQILNRLSTDGEVLRFNKNGSTKGAIGVESPNFYIGMSGGSGIYFGGSRVQPMSNLSKSDNTIDMGHPSFRWQDVYATNGTIQTSDRNEKQDIEALSDAEQRVAVAAKGLLRKYRWKDKVAEKGDEARIHFGIIAQDLQAAFEAEGLDAGRYGMFISSSWWEAEVEKTRDVEQEDGTTITETYTATETYDEPTEGAVERTRLGVRYPELLAFIIAAL